MVDEQKPLSQEEVDLGKQAAANMSEKDKKENADRIKKLTKPRNTEPGSASNKGKALNDVDTANPVQEGALDAAILQRFRQLEEWHFNNLSATSVKNLGFETGRPKANISDKLKGDSANAFTSPTLDALNAKPWLQESNGMATAEDIAKISALLVALGAPKERIAEVYWDIGRYCASVGTSPQVVMDGAIEIDGQTIMRDAVNAAIKSVTTLRKVCRLYAPVIWNIMVSSNSPPENWQAKGFTEETKFAAFDFFDYVENKAGVQPAERALVRPPSKEEKIAHATHKALALRKAEANRRFANYGVEVTGGKFGCPLDLKLKDSKCG